MKRNLIYLLVVCCLFVACDREKNKLRDGNKQYKESKFAESEKKYRESLAVDSTYVKAEYNLASASYKQEKGDKLLTAAKYYDSYQASLEQDDTLSYATTNYNLGNTYFKISQLDTVKQSEQYRFYLEKAKEYYKQSLRLNPQDSCAKYNLALTMHLLKDDEQKNKDQQQQQQDQQQQQQNQQQNNNNQQQPQQQNNNQNQNSGKQSEKTDKKPENNQMREGADKNKKQMERMLEALKNSEKQTLNKVKRKEEDNAQKRSIEKDW